MNFELYVVDTETTGLDPVTNEPVEISVYRLSNDAQKTWWLKPLNFESISTDALRINGHKLEDLQGHTKEGREKYGVPAKALVDIENWLMEDGVSSGDRILVGQNIAFDKAMLLSLWKKCNSPGTFPFNEKYSLDTMGIEFFSDYCREEIATGYSLSAMAKKHGIKNEKAHSAADDVRATVALFRKQVESFRALLK
jgi:DNA polymerase III epsilon subunit-like protein